MLREGKGMQMPSLVWHIISFSQSRCMREAAWGKESKVRLLGMQSHGGLGPQESTAGQEVTELYQEAPGRQNPGVESLFDCDALDRFLDVMWASRQLVSSTEPTLVPLVKASLNIPGLAGCRYRAVWEVLSRSTFQQHQVRKWKELRVTKYFISS